MFGEGMCYGQYCELCKTADSQICTLETNNTVYVNINNIPIQLPPKWRACVPSHLKMWQHHLVVTRGIDLGVDFLHWTMIPIFKGDQDESGASNER